MRKNKRRKARTEVSVEGYVARRETMIETLRWAISIAPYGRGFAKTDRMTAATVFTESGGLSDGPDKESPKKRRVTVIVEDI